MESYIHRLCDALLSSEIIPAFIRVRAMRMVGYRVSRTTTIWANAKFGSKRIETGENVFINYGFYFDGNEHLKIGSNVRIAQFVRVLTATHAIGPPQQRCPVDVLEQPVAIGDGCWIGCGVTIFPGVKISDGCVVAANSLLISSTEPNGLYMGAPARRVRTLAP